MALVRVTVTLPPELVSTADRVADGRGLSRSGLLAEALEKHLIAIRQESSGGRVFEPAAAAYVASVPNETLLEELGRRLGIPPQVASAAPPLGSSAPRIRFDHGRLAAVCRRHHVAKLSLFGSVLTDSFESDSDVDVLVEFEPGRTPGLGIVDLEDDLSAVFGGRRVDLVTERSLHPLIREPVLASAELQFAV
jgi:predicted nucleotidyltransferase